MKRWKFGCLLAVALASASLVSTSHAQGNVTANTRARLKNAADAVAGIQTPDPAKLTGAARDAKVREIAEAVDMARAQVGMVTRADKGSPPVVAMVAYLDKLDVYRQGLAKAAGAAAASSADARAKTRKFLSKYLPMKDDVLVGLRLQRDPDSTEFYFASKSSLERLDAVLQAVAPDCQGEFAGVADDPIQPEVQYKASLWCAAAANREAVIARGLRNAFLRRIRELNERLDAVTKKLTPIGDGFILDFGSLGTLMYDPDTFEARVRAEYKESLGVEAPPGGFDEVRTKASALRAHLEAAAGSYKPLGGKKASVPAIKAEVEAKVQRLDEKKAKIKGVLGVGDWVLHRDKLNRIIMRERSGYVLYQVGNEKLCRLERWIHLEDGDGKRWKLKKYELRNLVRIQTCK